MKESCMGETKQFVTEKPKTGNQASQSKQVDKYIEKLKIVEVGEGEVHRREETIVRLVFSAARRKMRKRQGISPLLTGNNNLSRD